MKQIWPNYSYSPATNVLTLTGLNIDRDQLLLVAAPERGRIMYNFADSSVTASAFTAGANTSLTLVASTAGLTTTASLVIYYDDQLPGSSVTISSLPAINGTVTANADSASLKVALDNFGANYDNAIPVAIDQAGFGNVPISGTVTANLVGWDGGNFENTRIGGYSVGGGDSNRLALEVIGVDGNPLPISGTVTANTILPQITWTNYSGSITTAGTAVTAVSNINRNYLLVQVTTGQMFLNIGATATTLNSVYFSAGQGFAWETSVPQGQVSIISTVTGTNYVLKEG